MTSDWRRSSSLTTPSSMPGEIWDISEISWVYRRGINNQQQPTIWLLALVLIVPKIAECVNFHAGHDCSTPVKPPLPAFQGSSNHHNHSWSIDLDTPHQPSPKKITHFWEMLFPPSNIALWLAPNYSGKRPWLRKPRGPPPKIPMGTSTIARGWPCRSWFPLYPIN